MFSTLLLHKRSVTNFANWEPFTKWDQLSEPNPTQTADPHTNWYNGQSFFWAKVTFYLTSSISTIYCSVSVFLCCICDLLHLTGSIWCDVMVVYVPSTPHISDIIMF